jgi:uncharacterized protein (TIGR02596 family)
MDERYFSPPTMSLTLRRGFSLIELLVVMGIVILLMALVIPSFQSVGRAQALTGGASQVVGSLDLARQIALAENRQIEVRFYKANDALGGNSAFRAFRVMQVQGNQARQKLQRLPTGIIFDSDPNFSTLLSAANPNGGSESIPGQSNTEYKSVRINAEGRTTLDPLGVNSGDDEWFLTLRSETGASTNGKPANNFITVQIDPLTGRSRTFQP